MVAHPSLNFMLYAHCLFCLCVKMITILFYKVFIVFYPVKTVYCDLFHILLSVTHGSVECIYVRMCVLTLKHLSSHAAKVFCHDVEGIGV